MALVGDFLGFCHGIRAGGKQVGRDSGLGWNFDSQRYITMAWWVLSDRGEENELFWAGRQGTVSTGSGFREYMLLLSIFHTRESAYSAMGTGPKTVGRSLGTYIISHRRIIVLGFWDLRCIQRKLNMEVKTCKKCERCCDWVLACSGICKFLSWGLAKMVDRHLGLEC